MNKKGFTLIELLGSVVILAALALIAFPAILSVLNSGQEKVDDSIKKYVETAAADYISDNMHKITDKTGNISGCALVEGGYISTTFYKQHKDEVKNCKVAYNISARTYEYEYHDAQPECNVSE